MKIYNTLTRQKEEFIPVHKDRVGIYGCGVTPYKPPHLGHAMQGVFFDIFRRYFEYKGFDVTYVRNYTDVDDKIINASAELGIHPLEHSKKIMHQSDEDFAQLRVKKADYEPKVSENIEGIISMTQKLIEKGFAYATKEGNVYFRVKAHKSYGKLSNQKVEELRKGTRKKIETDKEDTVDFALWKSANPDEQLWESPWGHGRPGWHIECSVMANRYLGKHFDIHGGGGDLIFPHHDNEIAQSESAHGGEFANYWMHNGLLMVGKEKMSKSLNNDTSIREWLEKFHPEVIRYMIISNHYRSHVQFNEHRYEEANRKVYQIYQTLILHKSNEGKSIDQGIVMNEIQKFEDDMDNDFNTVKVISQINGIINTMNKSDDLIEISSLLKVLKVISPVIGLFDLDPKTVITEMEDLHLNRIEISRSEIENLLKRRKEFRDSKNYDDADKIRDELIEKRIDIIDDGNESRWILRT